MDVGHPVRGPETTEAADARGSQASSVNGFWCARLRRGAHASSEGRRSGRRHCSLDVRRSSSAGAINGNAVVLRSRHARRKDTAPALDVLAAGDERERGSCPLRRCGSSCRSGHPTGSVTGTYAALAAAASPSVVVEGLRDRDEANLDGRATPGTRPRSARERADGSARRSPASRNGS